MKKLLSIIALAGIMTACNDRADEKSAASTDTTMAPAETQAPIPDTSLASATPAMKDSVMTMKDGKMMIAKGGNWEPMTSAVTCTNGRKVSVNGEVSKSGKSRKLTEGMMIDKDGQLMDKDGKMMDNTGWE